MKNGVKIFLLITLIFFAVCGEASAKCNKQQTETKNLVETILNDFLQDNDNAETFLLENSYLKCVAISAINNERKSKIKIIKEAFRGERIYSFKSVNIKKNSATVEFGYEWTAFGGGYHAGMYAYKCKKSKTVWDCELFSMRLTQS